MCGPSQWLPGYWTIGRHAVASRYGAAVEACPWQAGDRDGEGNDVSPNNEAAQDRYHAWRLRMRPGGCAGPRDAFVVSARQHCLGVGSAVKSLLARLDGGLTWR